MNWQLRAYIITIRFRIQIVFTETHQINRKIISHEIQTLDTMSGYKNERKNPLNHLISQNTKNARQTSEHVIWWYQDTITIKAKMVLVLSIPWCVVNQCQPEIESIRQPIIWNAFALHFNFFSRKCLPRIISKESHSTAKEAIWLEFSTLSWWWKIRRSELRFSWTAYLQFQIAQYDFLQLLHFLEVYQWILAVNSTLWLS